MNLPGSKYAPKPHRGRAGMPWRRRIAGEHQREVATDGGHPVTGLARGGERPRVERANPRQHLRDGTDVGVVAILFGQLEAVQPWRDVAMNQHALNDLAQRREVRGQSR